jgi:hypothetical protein
MLWNKLIMKGIVWLCPTFSQRSTEFYRFQIRMLDVIAHPVKLHKSQIFKKRVFDKNVLVVTVTKYIAKKVSTPRVYMNFERTFHN